MTADFEQSQQAQQIDVQPEQASSAASAASAIDAVGQTVKAVAQTVSQAAAEQPGSGNAVRICVDADGGDDAPGVVTEGLRKALQDDPDLSILLVGRESSIRQIAGEFPNRIEPVVTTEVIEMSDHPAEAVRSKKDSSIVVGCKLVHQGLADGFYSAGSTGACLTAATVRIGRIEGVVRPALATIVPVPGKPVILLDVGANSDCKPEYLVQFAHMGRAYGECFFGMNNPTVGLLNNGTEDTKGNELAKQAFELLQSVPNFCGNVEGNGLMRGEAQVVVTDGFSGNITIKIIEGTAAMIFKSLKGIMTSSLGNKLAAAKLSGDIHEFRATVDPDTYGGAPLLGTKAVCIVGHGSSSPQAIANGVAACAKSVRGRLPQRIAEALANR